MLRVARYPENPVVTPAMVPPSRPDFEVTCAFNAGVAKYGDEIILLLRVAERAIAEPGRCRIPVLNCDGPTPVLEVREFDTSDPDIDFSDSRAIRGKGWMLLTTISHLRVARSTDGRHFTVDPTPALFPDNTYEMWGIEDPRVTEIDGAYYIVYKGVSPNGITSDLAVTRDFIHYERQGVLFCPENLDVCIFPEKINGRYVALHRPVPRMIGTPNMWVAYSPDLLTWGRHEFLMGTQPGKWDGGRVGGGAVPFKTERGWVEIYHAATEDDIYCLGAVLLDLHQPHKILARSAEPILRPEALYETTGFFPNVVFTCGALVNGDTVSIYYGASDHVMAGADMSITEILDSLVPVE